MHRRLFLSLFLVAVGSIWAGPITPLPYLSFSDSPFNGKSFEYFHLEDFEDGALNTPGVTANAGMLLSPSVTTDAVDADMGPMDGSGQGGRTLYTSFATNSLAFDFDVLALSVLPTYVGLVWTDVGGAGAVSGLGLVEFGAFDHLGASLGVTSAILGDGDVTGATAEDRFFGFFHAAGISRIEMRMPDSTDWEVDHLQYGKAIPEPGAFALAGLAIVGLFVVRRVRT